MMTCKKFLWEERGADMLAAEQQGRGSMGKKGGRGGAVCLLATTSTVLFALSIHPRCFNTESLFHDLDVIAMQI